MKGRWNKMKGSCVVRLSKISRKISDWNWMNIFTFIIALATIGSVYVSRLQWNVIDKQLNISLADQRPWIKVDLHMNGPITFSESGDAQIYTFLNIKNIGHSPARNIHVDFEAHPVTKTNIIDTISNQEKECSTAEGFTAYDKNSGHNLFPDDSETDTSSISVSSEEMAASPTWPNNKNVTFLIDGCIDYTYSSDNKHGQTGFAYQLGASTGTSEFIISINPKGGTVPYTSLKLMKDFFHGGILN